MNVFAISVAVFAYQQYLYSGTVVTSEIVASQEVEIRRITVQGQPRQKVCKTSFRPGRLYLSSQLSEKHK
jgi:hypothetical protein